MRCALLAIKYSIKRAADLPLAPSALTCHRIVPSKLIEIYVIRRHIVDYCLFS